MKKTTVEGLGYTGISVEHIDHDLSYQNYVRETPTYMNPPSEVPRSKRKEEEVDEFRDRTPKKTTQKQDNQLKKAREKDLKSRNINS